MKDLLQLLTSEGWDPKNQERTLPLTRGPPPQDPCIRLRSLRDFSLPRPTLVLRSLRKEKHLPCAPTLEVCSAGSAGVGGGARGRDRCAVECYGVKCHVLRHLDFLIQEKQALSLMLGSIILSLAAPCLTLVNSHVALTLHASRGWWLSWCVLGYFMALLQEQR